MLHYARFYPFAALASLLIVAARASASVALEVSVDSQPIPERVKELKLSQPVKGRSWKEKILLDADRLVVEEPERRVILDFKSRRKYIVDAKAGTYSDWSLYADAGFRTYEIMNREYLARALEKIQPGRTKTDLALAEHELAIAHPRTPGKPDVAMPQGATEFKVGELTVFRMSREGTGLSERDARAFGRYFRYFKGGHPAALAALEAQKNLPAQIAMTSSPFQAVRATLSFTRIPLEAAPSASLEGLRKVAPTKLRGLPDDIAEVALRIAGEKPTDIARKAQQTYSQAEADFVQGNVVRGFLGALEYNLQKGIAINDLLRQHRAAIVGSPNLAALIPYLGNSKDKDEAERAIAALRKARSEAGDKAYVLGIFEANHHSRVGRPADASALFVAALRANPYIAGAWKDLGDLRFGQFMVAEAWICWDTGRKIAPEFENFRPVTQFEERLVRDHPEYF